MTAVERASLREENGPGEVRFHFNPTTIGYSRQAQFNRQPTQGSAAEPPTQFTGVDATQLQLQLLFDAMGAAKADGVQPEIDQLVAWTKLPEGADAAAASPAKLLFTWGRLKIVDTSTFRCHLERLQVTMEMFDPDGVPLRATVAVTLKSAAPEPQPTNPTSGTERSRRRRVLRPGQTLQQIAHAEYGDPGLWRAVADLNGIDDPMRLRAETEILLPDPTELAGRRRS